jgi:hypothetical protein
MDKDKDIRRKHEEKYKEQIEKAGLAEQAWELEKKKKVELRQKELQVSLNSFLY